MKTRLALVLSGGGSRGALQAGALKALHESGFQPDMFVGTSIGAVNAAFLALNGFSSDSLERLSQVWKRAAQQDLLPSNYIWLAVRSMLGRSTADPSRKIRDFFCSQGIAETLTFGDLGDRSLIIVSSDLNSGRPFLHGLSPEEHVLEALLLSTALPPWIMPVHRQGRYLMDGGVVSNLPVEPALQAGATEIIALDLGDVRETPGLANRLARFIDRLTIAVERRETDLELQLADARGVRVRYIPLASKETIPYWDFQHTEALIEQGYEVASQAIAAWPADTKPAGPRSLQTMLKKYLESWMGGRSGG